jgi:hypothetical protein
MHLPTLRHQFAPGTGLHREDIRQGMSREERILFGFLLGMGLVALACGGFLVVDGLGMPKSTLDHSPFESFLWPGIMLGLVVGGSHLVAARMIWFRQRDAASVSVLAAVILLGWIGVETVMVRDGRMLQAGIMFYAVIELVLAVHLHRQPMVDERDCQ